MRCVVFKPFHFEMQHTKKRALTVCLNELLPSESQSNHHQSQEIKHCQPCYESSAFTLLITTPSFFLFVTTILILWKNSSCFSLVLVLRYGFNFTKFRLNLELTPTGVSS